MKLLLSYLRAYRGFIILALVLAAINQMFSMMDPLIVRYIIDDYATKFDKYTSEQFFKGVGLLLGLVSSLTVLAAGLNGIVRRPEL
jgi:ATP-binding cassette subfamily B protein